MLRKRIFAYGHTYYANIEKSRHYVCARNTGYILYFIYRLLILTKPRTKRGFVVFKIINIHLPFMSPNIVSQIQNGGAVVGDTVRVKMQNGTMRDFMLVSQQDASPAQGKISNTSPIGQALLGCLAGEKRQYTITGQQTFEIEVLEVVKPASA